MKAQWIWVLSAVLCAGTGVATAQREPNASPTEDARRKVEKATARGLDPASAKQVAEVENPRVAEQEASMAAALQNQKRAVDAEVVAQTKVGLKPATVSPGPSQTMASHSGGMLSGAPAGAAAAPVSQARTGAAAATSAPTQTAPPVKTGSNGTYSMAGGGTVNPPVASNSRFSRMPAGVAGNYALTCATNPAMRIITVAGMPAPAVFTPITAFDLYTVTGCSFGNLGPDAKAYIYKGGGFREDFQIQEWHDNWLKISLDPKISGVLDQDEVTLVIQRADGTQVSKGSFKFHAVRAVVPLQLIPSRWATLVTWTQDNKTFSPDYSSPALIQGKAAGPSAYVARYRQGEKFDPNAQAPNQQYDTYDFSGLAPGWVGKSAQLKTYDTECPFVVTYRGNFGNWRTQWDGNSLRVYLGDQTCSWVNPALPTYFGTNWTGSFYKLTVSAYGPRCTDPLTGKPDNQCIQQVQKSGQ